MMYVIAIGAFQALAAIALLWKNKLHNKADALLILLLGCIAAHLTIKFCIYSFVSDGHVRTQMNTFIGFCYGPLLYLYAARNKDAAFIPASRWYVFLPFILSAVGYLTVICVLSLSQPAGYFALNIYNTVTTWLIIPLGFLFPLLALRIARNLPNGLSPEKQLIHHISYCFMAISMISAIFQTLHYVSLSHPDQIILCRNVVYSILLGVCLIIIRYKYAGPVAVAAALPIAAASTETPAATRKTQLKPEEHREIWEKLQAHLTKTKIFTDADLNLDKLAQAVGINKYHLSETLNSYADTSFYQYINEQRIQYATAQMRYITGKSLPVNVLTLAYDCGFKAKSSFNLYFKKITGTTPTAYLKNLSAQLPVPGNI